MQIHYKNLDDLIPYERNAKLHPDSQVAKIAQSIQEFGFRNPVLISNGEVVAGHGRIMAAKNLGMEQVPCIDISDMTPEQIKAFRLADNRTAQSDWDWDLVKVELEELQGLDFDIEVTGFDEVEIESITDSFDAEEAAMPEMSNEDRSPIQQMTFTLHDDQVEVVKEALQKAKDMGPFVDTGNENGNGNALARIAEAYNG